MSPDYFEVIVVDDGSHDDTPGICHMMRHELPNLKYIAMAENAGIPKARNRGIEVSSGNHVLFTDDDCIPAMNWIERMSAALDRDAIVAGAVSTTTSNYFKLCHNIAQFYPFMPGRKAGPTEFIVGANMGFRRSVLEDLGGFLTDEKWECEDFEMILRARSKGYCAFFEPEAMVTHDPDRTTLTGILRYAADHASSTILLRNQYRSLLDTPFVLRSPFFLLAAAPIIALKVTSNVFMNNRGLSRFFRTAPVVYALKLAWCWGAARGLYSQRHGKVR
jgi:GT2 family glycosyltransferase